jgi:hypothetical protein
MADGLSQHVAAGRSGPVAELTEYFVMSDNVHKFKVGQTVDLIPSTFRSAAAGQYEIVSLRPVDGDNPKYCVKSKSESHVRVVSESDLILSPELKVDFG